jgi:DNA-binding CsgD family transcriptional regulator/tetratricopeptide (TPR) repeat protein
MILTVDILDDGRAALQAREWATAFELLSDARAATTLAAEDLDGLAEASWWLGRLNDCIEAREAAFDGFSAAGDTERAAMAALLLSLHYGDIGKIVVAGGWRARAERLVAEHPDSPTHGFLLTLEAGVDYHSGRAEECISKAKLATNIGQISMDGTLVSFALHCQGLGLMKQGKMAQAWALLDESMIDAAAGRLHPVWAGRLHCGMIQLCEQLEDPRRGWQWIEATEQWLEGFPEAVLFSGVCRVHKARLMQQRGRWPEAEIEAQQACDELRLVHVYTTAQGYYEVGEIKRLTGDYAAAEELFRLAHQLGFDPQPGLARLRLTQGKTEAAIAGIRRALDDAPDRLARGRLLPHLVEISIVEDDLRIAAAAADELDAIVMEFPTEGMTAHAVTTRGAVLFAQSEYEAALPVLGRAARLWTEIGCTYQAGLVRVLTGRALRARGDEEGAAVELEAARQTFEHLGAVPDERRAAEFLSGAPHAGGLSDREVEVLRLVAAGRSNKQIAAELFISERTVARHMSNIFVKLAVSSRAAVAAFALKHGLA